MSFFGVSLFLDALSFCRRVVVVPDIFDGWLAVFTLSVTIRFSRQHNAHNKNEF